MLVSASLAAAEITLRSGKKINGKVISEDATSITISEVAGTETKIIRSEVVSVNYQNTYSIETPVLSDDDVPGDIRMSGSAGFFGFHIGYAITENLILMVALNGFAASELQPEFNGQVIALPVDLGIPSRGIGLSYYIMPMNLYLSADIGVASVRITRLGESFGSEAGIGGNFQIGKEWWVSDNWGLGLAIFIHSSSMKDGSETSPKPDITNTIVGLAFSATYN